MFNIDTEGQSHTIVFNFLLISFVFFGSTLEKVFDWLYGKTKELDKDPVKVDPKKPTDVEFDECFGLNMIFIYWSSYKPDFNDI